MACEASAEYGLVLQRALHTGESRWGKKCIRVKKEQTITLRRFGSKIHLRGSLAARALEYSRTMLLGQGWRFVSAFGIDKDYLVRLRLCLD